MALRIGEILVRDGLVTSDDVEAALVVASAKQVRLASALVSLGMLGADDAARALARQLGVPAALEKHLAARDDALADLLSAQTAWSLGALPLATQRGRDALVVCVRDPAPATVSTLEQITERPVVVAVAAECVLLPLIAETYPVTLASEPIPYEVDVDLETGPTAALDPAHLQLVDLDFGPNVVPPRRFLSPTFPIANPCGVPLDPALVALASAETPDEVVDTVVGYLRHGFVAGAVLLVKEGYAVGQAGFGELVLDDAIAGVVVPLNASSALRLAVDGNAGFVGAPPDAGPVQDRFFDLFGGPPPTLVVAPVAMRGRVSHLLYAHGPRARAIEDAAAELGTVADAAADALIRIRSA